MLGGMHLTRASLASLTTLCLFSCGGPSDAPKTEESGDKTSVSITNLTPTEPSTSPKPSPTDDLSVRELREFLEALPEEDTMTETCPMHTVGLTTAVETQGRFEGWKSTETPFLASVEGTPGGARSDADQISFFSCPYIQEIPDFEMSGIFNDPQLVVNAMLLPPELGDDIQALRQEWLNGDESNPVASDWLPFGGGHYLTVEDTETVDGEVYETCVISWIKQRTMASVTFSRVSPFEECGDESVELFLSYLPQLVRVSAR